MNLISATFSFNFGDLNDFYFKLLKEEDFDFKSKQILINIENNRKLDIGVECSNVLDLKIVTNALIKSIETINKTLNV